MKKTVLEISDLRGGYLPGIDILQGIDFSIGTGEVVGVIGLNGSGKSTLGKSILNMIPYRDGRIIFHGEDISKLRTYQIGQKGIAIMQQGGLVFQNLSVWENLELAMGGKAKINSDELKTFIPLLELSPKELNKKMADKLSGGQRHQLALAMALAARPSLLILDEPSAGLSPKAVEDMYRSLEEMKRLFKVSILLIEQNVTKACSFCDRCLMLKTGTIFRILEKEEFGEIENTLFK